MNRYDLYRSFGEIDDEILLRSEARRAPRRLRAVIRAAAAMLALALCAFGVSRALRSGETEAAASWFVVTARAEDGALTPLGPEDWCLNSGGGDGNIFGVDVPLFDLVLTPACWEEDKAAYFKLDASLSYNGNTVGAGDGHVGLTHSFPAPGADEPARYGVVGWFEEPTDLTVTFTDRESGAVVETLTINVTPAEDLEGYRLTVTEIRSSRSN